MGVVVKQTPIKDDDYSKTIDQHDGNVSLDFSDSSGCETCVDEVSAPLLTYLFRLDTDRQLETPLGCKQ